MKSIAQIILASSCLIAFSSAQSYPPVNPDDIDSSIRDIWCTDQEAACPLICMDQERVGASQNECDPDTLQYTCICENHKSPNLTEYSLTIPYELCRQSVINCSNNCNGDASCATLCATGKKCGASDPRRVNTTATTSTSTATQTSYSTKTGSSKSTSTSSSGDDFRTGNVASTLAGTGAMGLVVIVAAGLGFFGLL